jgi:hypothetical protein
MGYFFALSKSSTSTALNWSELALLVFGIVLVIGLVGEYKTLEPHSRRMKLFEMLVIIGVLGELLGDGGVFLFSNQLQVISDKEIAEAIRSAGDAKLSAEAAREAARIAQGAADDVSNRATRLATDLRETAKQQELTAKEQTEFTLAVASKVMSPLVVGKELEALKGLPPATAIVLYKEGDGFAFEYASSIVRALSGVGWSTCCNQPTPTRRQPYHFAGVNTDPIVGTWVAAREAPSVAELLMPKNDRVALLRSLLRAQFIKDETLPENTFLITVGQQVPRYGQ